MPRSSALEARTYEGNVRALVSRRSEADGFLVAFTERSGGVSRGRFRSLNLGLRAGDEPDRVVSNRERVCAALGIEPFAWPEQVHGARSRRIGPRKAGAGFADPDEAVAGADALITSSRRLPLAVMVADCVPLALVAPARGTVGVVHAGWRGVAGGIVPEALRVLGADPSDVRASIGPAIGPDHYEVGEDVALAVAAASPGGARTKRSGARLLLDLPGTVALILQELGVRTIERARECTACEAERFFSYRRDGDTGRQALVAARL
jgi:YfiH family protein